MAIPSKRRGSIDIQYVSLKIQDPIKVEDSAQFLKDIPKPVIHLKGFTTGIDFADENTKHLLTRCVSTLRAMLKNGGTLAWDGNAYKQSSFTYVIPCLFEQLFNKESASWKATLKNSTNPDPKWLFCGFSCRSDLSRFHKSWHNRLQSSDAKCIERIKSERIQFFAQPIANVATLRNLHTLKTLNITKSKLVLCFGGGVALKREYQRIINPNNSNPWPNFYVFGVGRHKQKQFECSSLKTLFGLNAKGTKYSAKQNVLKIAYFDGAIDEWSQEIMDPITVAKTVGYIAQKSVAETEQKSSSDSRSRQFNVTYNPKKGWTSAAATTSAKKTETAKIAQPTPTQRSSNPYLDASLMASLNLNFSSSKNQQFETQISKKKKTQNNTSSKSNTKANAKAKRNYYASEW